MREKKCTVCRLYTNNELLSSLIYHQCSLNTMNNYKTIFSEFLINSFVDDYAYNKCFVDHLNREFALNNISFRYSYDSYCVELLTRVSYIVDILCNSSKDFSQLCDQFSYVVKRLVSEMMRNKIQQNEDLYEYAA